MTCNMHAFAQIKAVGVEALHTEVEVWLLAVFVAGVIHQPVEQGLSGAA